MNEHDKKVLFSSGKDDWETPDWFYNELNKEMRFTLDPCCTDENNKCDIYFTEKDDGLKQNWKGHRVFVNPPYSRKCLRKWVEKSCQEGFKENTIVVVLLPARVDTKYTQEIIFPYASIVCFIKGRIKFKGAKHGAPFPSMVCVFSSEEIKNKELFIRKLDDIGFVFKK